MILEACRCSWDIPGVDALPAHTHRHMALMCRKTNGQMFWCQHHDAVLNLDQFDIVDELESVEIWVDWRKVARA